MPARFGKAVIFSSAAIILIAVIFLLRDPAMDGTMARLASRGESQTQNFSAATLFPENPGLRISGVTAVPGCSGASVHWSTDKPSSSMAEWSAGPGGPYSSISDPAEVEDHLVILSGLAPGTNWFYRVTSAITGGPSVTSMEQSFVTLSGGMPALSLISASPYWDSYEDYLQRFLSVDFILGNAGPGAYHLSVAGTVNTNGVVDIAASGIADIPAGGSSGLSIKYHVETGITRFQTKVYLTAADACGSTYSYPGPFPGS